MLISWQYEKNPHNIISETLKLYRLAVMMMNDDNSQQMMQIEELMSKLINCFCGHLNAYIQNWQFC